MTYWTIDNTDILTTLHTNKGSFIGPFPSENGGPTNGKWISKNSSKRFTTWIIVWSGGGTQSSFQ